VSFEEFQARKREAEAATVRVTWKRVQDGTGAKLYSGLGPHGQLVYARREPTLGQLWEFGRNTDGVLQRASVRPTLAQAKRDAEQLLQPRGARQ
jgi:hypothetical protein